LKGFEL